MKPAANSSHPPKKIWRFIPSLDCLDLGEAMGMVEKVGRLDVVQGFKVGFSLGLAHGLKTVVAEIKARSDKPVIYDHQKAATDIPDTGVLFARTLKLCGIDEAILFPQAGPATLKAWAEELGKAGLKVVGGGIMTHSAYLQSEGGFLADSAPAQMYRLASAAGVKTFVVPLTKPRLVKELFDQGVFGSDPEFYSPGFGAQGGEAGAFGFLARHALIVGRSLFKAPDPAAYLHNALKELERSS